TARARSRRQLAAEDVADLAVVRADRGGGRADRRPAARNRDAPAPGFASAELLGQRDDDALRAADVTEPIAVLVLRHLANELGAMGAQAGKDVLDVFDGEHDVTYAQRIRRCVFRLSADGRLPVELCQLKPAVAVRVP